MNCHENNKEKHNQSDGRGHGHGLIKHMLMMAMCCGLPIIILLVLPVFGIFGSGFKSSIASVVPFLCPLIMALMLPMMLRSSKSEKSCCDLNKEQIKIE